MNKMQKPGFKTGIFGASFNPLHLGHLNLLVQVQEKFEFDLIKIIPTFQSPLTPPIEGNSPEKRLAMVRKVFKDYPFVEVDDQEIKREGVSYTIDTIKDIERNNPSFKDIFLIIGIDQLVQFDKWKSFKTIIEKVHLVVCSRKGYKWGISVIPPPLQSCIQFLSEQQKKDKIGQINIRIKGLLRDKIKNKVKLITGKNIYWLPLNDMDISSSQIRERYQQNLFVSHLVPPIVDQYIQRQNLYQVSSSFSTSVDTLDLIRFCVNALLDKKAQKVKVFDLRQFPSLPFDFTLVVSGLNIRHTKVMASYLHRQVQKKFSVGTQQMEGQANGEWIVLDYGELVVHVFYDYTRDYYCLEDLWQKAPVQEFLIKESVS